MTDDYELIEGSMDGRISDAGEAALEAADADLVTTEEFWQRAKRDMEEWERRFREDRP